MDGISGWVLTLCCAALTGGILQILSPGDSMNRIFQMIIGVFFLCCLIAPLSECKIDHFFKNQNFGTGFYIKGVDREISQAADELFLSSASEKIKILVQKKLEEMGIKNARLSVYITETDNQIEAEDIEIEAVLPKEYESKHDEISQRLNYELGTTIRIGYLQDEGESLGAETQ